MTGPSLAVWRAGRGGRFCSIGAPRGSTFVGVGGALQYGIARRGLSATALLFPPDAAYRNQRDIPISEFLLVGNCLGFQYQRWGRFGLCRVNRQNCGLIAHSFAAIKCVCDAAISKKI